MYVCVYMCNIIRHKLNVTTRNTYIANALRSTNKITTKTYVVNNLKDAHSNATTIGLDYSFVICA